MQVKKKILILTFQMTGRISNSNNVEQLKLISKLTPAIRQLIICF